MKRILAYLARRRSSFAYHVSFDAPLRVGAGAITIPVIRGMGLAHLQEDHEEGLGRVICHLLKYKPGTFVDVGANIGQTLVKVAACDPHRRYLGFEVQPSCIGYLAQLIETNRLSGFSILPIGLYSQRGLAALSCDSTADAGATLLPNIRVKTYSTSFPVYVETGDEIFGNCAEDALAVIKIDVEGAESQVLRGLTQTLAKYQPVLLLEILPTRHLTSQPSLSGLDTAELIRRRKENNDDILRLTRDLGYSAFRILHDGTLEPNDEFEMDTYDHSLVNYLFCPAADLPILTAILRQ